MLALISHITGHGGKGRPFHGQLGGHDAVHVLLGDPTWEADGSKVEGVEGEGGSGGTRKHGRTEETNENRRQRVI